MCVCVYVCMRASVCGRWSGSRGSRGVRRQASPEVKVTSNHVRVYACACVCVCVCVHVCMCANVSMLGCMRMYMRVTRVYVYARVCGRVWSMRVCVRVRCGRITSLDAVSGILLYLVAV